MVMDQTELLNRCRKGDELAWEMLVRRQQGRVCAMVFGYLGDREETLDVAQDIFVRLYRKLDQCTDADKFPSWLISIVRNACLDHLRRRKARPPRQDIPAAEMTSLASASPNPEEQWYRTARRRLVHRALQDLSEINREVILLKDIQGLSLEQVSDVLQVPLGTVKSRASRARLELAQAITALEKGPDGGFPSATEAVS